jgi:hypothetical protein
MRLPKVTEKLLGREKAYGRWTRRGIAIDPRLKARYYLAVLIHESMHEFLPYLDEDEVQKVAPLLAAMVWRQGFRKLDQ